MSKKQAKKSTASKQQSVLSEFVVNNLPKETILPAEKDKQPKEEKKAEPVVQETKPEPVLVPAKKKRASAKKKAEPIIVLPGENKEEPIKETPLKKEEAIQEKLPFENEENQIKTTNINDIKEEESDCKSKAKKNSKSSSPVVPLDADSKEKPINIKKSSSSMNKEALDMPTDVSEAEKKTSAPLHKSDTEELKIITVNDQLNKMVYAKEAKKEARRADRLSKHQKTNKDNPHHLPDDTVRYTPNITDGLTDDQITNRQVKGLVNQTKDTTSKSITSIFISNIFTFFNMLCLAIAIALIVFGKISQSYFLLFAIANTSIGIFQEIKAKNTIDKLKLVTAQNVKVVRNSKTLIIPAEQLVLDDIYVLANGDQIPTDSIIQSGEIEVNESLLTGESLPIKKVVGDTIFGGSFIVSGSTIVRANQVGQFNYAHKIQAKAKEYSKPKSELLTSLNSIIKIISIIIIPLGVALFITQWTNNSGISDPFLRASESMSRTAGSLIGMIPSGMYLLTSVALAVGIMNLGKKNTLVQDLYSIEMLARVNVLCLDKTGTLTDGTMKVSEVLVVDNNYDLPKLMGSYLNSFTESNQTTIALTAAYPLRNDYHSKAKINFSSARKFSAVSFFDEGTFVLGAPEYVYKTRDKTMARYISNKESSGMRVVMLCHSEEEIIDGEIKGRVSPVAIFVLEDHIRIEAPDTIKWFYDNGVEVKIISGDNPLTVSEIAKKCNVPHAEKCVSLEGLSINEVSSLVDSYTVFGRVSPEQKAAIIAELKKRQKTVGMTGDGVNDILAMKQADCSIAMANGASAARNVAHLVLLDSNFASLPAVVGEGRRVVNNIQRSSSLFLMKTIFTICFTIIVLLTYLNGGNGIAYPFETNNVMVMETIGIGLPSFFLALQKNDSLIKGHFIKNTFSRAIPGAICLILAIGINYILRYSGDFLDLGILSESVAKVSFTTFCSISMSIIAMGMVYNSCAPFNTYRLILFLSMIILFCLLTFVLPFIPAVGQTHPTDEGLFINFSTQFTGTDFRYLNKTMYLVLVIYAIGMPNLVTLLIDAFANMRGEKPTGLIFLLLTDFVEKKNAQKTLKRPSVKED
ncbi:MAG: HAD-IC family P-type ATPase [Bacilli bacterium]